MSDKPDQRSGKDPQNENIPKETGERVKSITGEVVVVRRKPDLQAVRKDLEVGTRRLETWSWSRVLSLAAPFGEAVLKSCHARICSLFFLH